VKRCQVVAAKAGSAAAVGLFVLGVVAGGTAAEASTAPPSPVGRYTATITDMGGPFSDPLTVKANGHFVFSGGPKGTWSETGDVVRMKGTIGPGTRFVFVIHQIGRNLGSESKQGTVTEGGTFFGSWYALRGTPTAAAGGSWIR